MNHPLINQYQSTKSREELEGKLVHEHIGLVKRVVGRLAIQLPAHVDREDLESVGLFGLLSAAQSYDEARGAAFSTFAYVAIRGAVLDELRRLDVLPRSRRSGVRAYDEARTSLLEELGREPTFLEIQEVLGLSAPELEEVLRARAIANAAGLGAGEASTGISPDTIATDGGEDPQLAAQLSEAKEKLAEAMATLPRREQEIVVLYFQGGLLLREIGQVMELTESRVSQILQHALVLLNHRLGEEVV